MWDIRDLENITKVADYTHNLADVVHNVHVWGRYAAVAWYTGGVRILDMIDPIHPREVGFFDTYPGASGGYNGVWEVYPYFPSGKIIASDRQSGLWVFTFNGAIAGSVSGIVRNASTNAPMPKVRVHVPELGKVIVSDAQGRYYVGSARGETLTLVTHEFGFAGTRTAVTLTDDLQQDILLQPLQMVPVEVIARDEQGKTIEGFSFAVEPYLQSQPSSNGLVTVMLPQDTTFIVTVGKWGYTVEEVTVTAQTGAKAIATLRRKYTDNATLDLGWNFSLPTDSTTRGGWLRTIARPTVPASDWLFPAAQPGGAVGYVFQAGPVPPAAPANFYDLNGRATLTSPLMDLTSYGGDPSVWYDIWFVHYERDTIRDTLKVQLTNDDGATWVTAYSEVKGRAGWTTRAIFIRDHLVLTNRMRIRFVASDSAGNATVMAAVDNVEFNPTHAAGVETENRGSGESGKRRGMMIAIGPNPVRAGEELRIAVAERMRQGRIEMFNSMGERIAVLHEGAIEAGAYAFRMDPSLPAGMYVVRWNGGSCLVMVM